MRGGYRYPHVIASVNFRRRTEIELAPVGWSARGKIVAFFGSLTLVIANASSLLSESRDISTLVYLSVGG
jgi:hypothetical protein